MHLEVVKDDTAGALEPRQQRLSFGRGGRFLGRGLLRHALGIIGAVGGHELDDDGGVGHGAGGGGGCGGKGGASMAEATVYLNGRGAIQSNGECETAQWY